MNKQAKTVALAAYYLGVVHTKLKDGGLGYEYMDEINTDIQEQRGGERHLVIYYPFWWSNVSKEYVSTQIDIPLNSDTDANIDNAIDKIVLTDPNENDYEADQEQQKGCDLYHASKETA